MESRFLPGRKTGDGQSDGKSPAAFVALVLLLSTLFPPPSSAKTGHHGRWRTVATIPLPGTPTRFDYESLDSRSGRLYMAHLGEGRLVVFDTNRRTVLADLPGFPHAHGVLAVPRLHRVYVTVSPLTRTPGRLAVVDTRTLKTQSLVPTGIHPDGLDYDPENRRLFVSDEWGQTVSVIDTRTDRTAGAIPLGGEVGNTRYDPISKRIFSTVQTKNLLAEIDPGTPRLVRRYPLPGGAHPHGLWIDGPRRLAFIACEQNAVLLVFDLETRKVTGRFPVGRRPDVLAFDPLRRRLFVASEAGTIAVFREQGHTLVEEGQSFLGHRAHVILFDPGTRLLYLPLENQDGHPVLKILRYETIENRP